MPHGKMKRIHDQMVADNARTGPAKSTRAQIAQQTGQQNQLQPSANKPACQLSTNQSSSACDITLKDDGALLFCLGQSDDGADELTVSPKFAESVILSGIGKLRKISTVTMQVALKEKFKANTFTFSRVRTVPRLFMHLSVGPLTLLNVIFPVADAKLAENNLLIEQTVLKHLGIDSKTMVENNCVQLNEIDCSGVPRNIKTSSSKGRILMARIEKVKNDAITNKKIEKEDKTNFSSKTQPRPRSNYYINKRY